MGKADLELTKKLKEQAGRIAKLERDAQIELALERVRAHTLEMNHSDELARVNEVLLEQIGEIGIKAEATWISLIDPEKQILEIWSNHGEQLAEPQEVSAADHPNHKAEIEAWKSGQEFIKISMPKKVFISYVKERFDFDVDDQKEKSHFQLLQIRHRFGLLGLGSWEEVKEEEYYVYRRFARVFEQTYTRFLDLQKAEAQAREAQIEAALERVRARTMAMHKSDELAEAAVLLYKEIKNLGITDFINCGYCIIDESNSIQHAWMTLPDGSIMEKFTLALIGDPVSQDRYDSWRRKDPIFVQKIKGQVLEEHVDFASGHFGSSQVEEVTRANFPDPTVFHCANFQHGYVCIIKGNTLDSDKQSLLIRFTKVFEQTYTRFRDLQKAEAQVREAQIETALERVRARTMAMHNSEELPDAAKTMFEQLESLGLKPWVCTCTIFRNESPLADNWASSQIGQMSKMVLPHDKDTTLKNIYKAWKNKKPLHVEVIEGQALVDHYEYMKSIPAVLEFFEEIADTEIPMPEYIAFNCASFNHGYLCFGTLEPEPDFFDIFQRFAKVFEQTYTRFLDLQKAEAQAHEAQIEAALERVRAAGMAMHQSDELNKVVGVMYDQLEPFEIASSGCELILCNETTDELEFWSVSFQAVMPQIHRIPRKSHPFFGQEWTAWKQQKDRLILTHKGKKKREFDAFIFSHTAFKNFPEEVKQSIRSTEVDVFSHVIMKYGLLEVIDQIPISEKDFQITPVQNK